MRLWIISGLMLFLLPSVSIGAEHYQHQTQCHRLSRQINHYGDVVTMAKQRNDRLWENATKAHMKRLADRRQHLCPGWGNEARFRKAMAEANQILKSAAQTAVRYFTFGAF